MTTTRNPTTVYIAQFVGLKKINMFQNQNDQRRDTGTTILRVKYKWCFDLNIDIKFIFVPYYTYIFMPYTVLYTHNNLFAFAY